MILWLENLRKIIHFTLSDHRFINLNIDFLANCLHKFDMTSDSPICSFHDYLVIIRAHNIDLM